MGMIRNAKKSRVSDDARRSLEEGHQIFVVKIRAGSGMTGVHTGPVPDVAEVIESAEAEGWTLVLPLSFSTGNDHSTTCYATFRPAA